MAWVSIFAVFFVLWWLVLFATLPFSLRTQDDEEEVTLGTASSAPHGAHIGRAMLRTTVVSLAIFAALYVLTAMISLGVDDLPRIVPDFG
jgi:predicted secreted protein